MRIYLLAVFILMFAAAYSQQEASNPFMSDGNGKPLFLKVNYTVEGSPFVFDDYRSATIIAQNGTAYNNVKTKFNLADRSLQYLDASGQEMVTNIPVKKIIFLKSTATSNALQDIVLESFSGALNKPGEPVYQVLNEGKARLLKKITVSYRDEKKYGEANMTRIFDRKEQLCLLTPSGEIKKMEKGAEFITNLLPDKKADVASFIQQNKLACRSEEEMLAVLNFYNR